MHHRFLLAFICFAMPLGSASAQNETFTGSVTTTESAAATLEQEAAQSELWSARQTRAQDFRTAMMATRRGVELFASYQEAYARNRLEHATACRQAKRKANKDGRLAVTARCYRTSLLMEREFWQKHVSQAQSLPGIQAPYRQAAIASLNNMIDAIDAIILGIDHEVYKDEAGLIEAKQNLHQKYRAQVSLNLSKMRADRTLTWLAHLMSRMLHLLETEPVNQATFAKLQAALHCLEMGELFMQEILLEKDYNKANLILSQSLQHLLTCGPHLKEGYELHNLTPNYPVN